LQLLLQLNLIYIIQLLSQLQLTATYFSVIFLFQLQLQLTEGTLGVGKLGLGKACLGKLGSGKLGLWFVQRW